MRDYVKEYFKNFRENLRVTAPIMKETNLVKTLTSDL